MQIISRQQAITQQLHRYYTGVPCKRGHLSERYTQMSACLECLHPKIANPAATERRETRRALAIAKLQMERLKVTLRNEHVEFYTDVLHALSTLREPRLSRSDVLTGFVPKRLGSNHTQHVFRMFPEDREALLQIRDGLGE